MTATITATPASVDPVPSGQKPSARDRILLGALLAGTAVLYIANITVNGSANAFYAGSAWAGSRSWKALLFGSVDPSNFITVDKPPLSQWIMGLSGQIFGYSSASMLIPEAVMGVLAVALTYAMLTRVGGRTAGLIAGTALALTPVAAMMFRFNNPDAAMVLMMTAASYCTIRATATASVRWLALAGAALGLAFLAKMLEGLMVLPALGLVYLIAAPTSVWRRIGHLLIAAAALVAAAGWYVVLTLIWPASSRPYLAGSTDNNFMNLVLGYNGLARVEGHSHNHGPANSTAALFSEFEHNNPDVVHRLAGNGMIGASPGITRLFSGEFGAEISFLLPSALIALVVVLVLRGRAPRTDMVRAGTALLGVWMLVDGIVLSYMNGTTHPYYSLAIAPPIAGLIGLGVTESWRATTTATAWRRRTGRLGISAMILAAAVWSFILLDREAEWLSWLKWIVLVGGIGVAAILMVTVRRLRRIAVATVGVGVLLSLAAPAALAINADTVSHTGGGPSVIPKTVSHHKSSHGESSHGFDRTPAISPALKELLTSSTSRWAAAVNRTATAAEVELSARVPVMGIGGFTDDPAPSLAEFERYVAQKQIGYYLAADESTARDRASQLFGTDDIGTAGEQLLRQFTSGRPGSVTNQIGNWVKANFAGQKMGDYTVYNLTATPSPHKAKPSSRPGSSPSTEPGATRHRNLSRRSNHHRTPGHEHHG